jgi:ribosomal protein RSM22 (predicted rRNA methylase)
MQIPPGLSDALSRELEGVSRVSLSERAARISEEYRAGRVSATAVRDGMDALAYAVTRMPATYGAVRNALARLTERCPEFAPRGVLDLGAGPGTASWAAVDEWPGIETITQIDSSTLLLRLGKKLVESALSDALRDSNQVLANITLESEMNDSADLAMLTYTLAELSHAELESVADTAWRQCAGALVLVEPGTPAGYARVLRARDLLLAQDARILAPCPHAHPCPLVKPDWCHFVQRIARTRDHRMLKAAELPYEDEKFSYLIAVREDLFHQAKRDRVLARPETGKTAYTAKACRLDGSAGLVRIDRRDKENFRRARKTDWGDEL